MTSQRYYKIQTPFGPLKMSFISDRFTERWVHQGVACGIAPSPATFSHAYNGYVQLPVSPVFDEAFKDWMGYDKIQVKAPGGLTYGPDPERWIGFDTIHGWDHWEGALPEWTGKYYVIDESTVRWTMEALKESVNQLAEQILQLAYGSRKEALPDGQDTH